MMSLLFTPHNIGSLELPNRLVRSATAENMADKDGKPLPALRSLYKELALGGVGLIISGHMYIHPGGKAHPEMTGIYSDDLLPDLEELVNVVHAAGGKTAVQVNHGGMQCSDEAVPELIAPSSINVPSSGKSTRAMTNREIEEVIDAFGKSARRVKQAGFDAVQIQVPVALYKPARGRMGRE